MNAGKRLRSCVVCMGLVAAVPAFASASASAAGTAPISPSAISSQSTPFLPLTGSRHAASENRSFQRGGDVAVSLRGTSDPSGEVAYPAPGAAAAPPASNAVHNAALDVSTPADNLIGFAGTAQASTIHSFGADQEVTPPNEDIAAGLVDVMEVVNSTVEVFSKTGAVLGAADLNSFMRVDRGYHSSDPRIIFDPGVDRFWITVTEVPNTSAGCPVAAPVLVAVSPNSNALPLTGWLVYALPIGSDKSMGVTMFGDQPGLGVDSNTIAVTFDDFSCDLAFLGSEVDLLQKTDLEHDTGKNQDDFFVDGPFAPQPVQSFGLTDAQYVITNESDCGPTSCTTPLAEVDEFDGTPEGGGVQTPTAWAVPMDPTAVDDTTGFLPPADQPSPGPQLQTNDDRFLNAVFENEEIWTADGTSCIPPGDTVVRACLDYVEIFANPFGSDRPTLTNQINNVGIDGADLFYPAVSVDSLGQMFTVFDESSTSMFPSVMDATISTGETSLSAFQTLHTSSTYYNGDDLFLGACDAEGCRWGDYSGASLDAENPRDVWVVSGSEDGTIEGACTSAHACWNTTIDQLTLKGPGPLDMTPGQGPVVGGQTVTITGYDFAADTTGTIGDGTTTIPLTVHVVNPKEVTFVSPPDIPNSPNVPIEYVTLSDSLGQTNGIPYEYDQLANYVPLSPFRILDTRSGGGGALGPGAVRTLQVTGVGPTPIPSTATAAVLNVTEVNGSGTSLLTVYPGGSPRPNASNLNFGPHTAIANLVTATLSGGQVDIYNAVGTVNVLVDVEGYFTPPPSTEFEGLFHPIAPLRVCDTRPGSHTLACRAHGALGPEAAMVVSVSGTDPGAIPDDGTAGAAILNVTGVAGTVATYLSVFPTNASGGCSYTGTHAPPFSTLNLAARGVGANRLMVELGPATTGGPDTSVCVYNAAGVTSVILDANGWFGSSTATATPAGFQYQALAPTRICDTRVGSASCTEGALGVASSRLIGVAGHALVPPVGTAPVVVAVIANLTAIVPSHATYLTLYPSSPGTVQTPPNTSDLNVGAGETLPNLAVVQLDTTAGTHNGFISLFNSVGAVNAVIDLEGWFQ